MIPGKEVEIGGKKYTLPPLNIPSLRLHKAFLDRAKAEFVANPDLIKFEDVAEMTDIVRESFTRNYPEVNFAETIEPQLDMVKVSELFGMVMGANGAGPALGEKRPGNP